VPTRVGSRLLILRAAGICSTCFTAARAGDVAVGKKCIALPLTGRTGERYVAHVLPLTSGARRKAGVSYSAAAAVFIRKAGLDLPSPPEAVAKQFKLTSAEVRVLFAIVQIGGVRPGAQHLGTDRQEPSASYLREDRHETTSGSGKAGRGFCGKTLRAHRWPLGKNVYTVLARYAIQRSSRRALSD
jgi:hypothetical protein